MGRMTTEILIAINGPHLEKMGYVSYNCHYIKKQEIQNKFSPDTACVSLFPIDRFDKHTGCVFNDLTKHMGVYVADYVKNMSCLINEIYDIMKSSNEAIVLLRDGEEDINLDDREKITIDVSTISCNQIVPLISIGDIRLNDSNYYLFTKTKYEVIPERTTADYLLNYYSAYAFFVKSDIPVNYGKPLKQKYQGMHGSIIKKEYSEILNIVMKNLQKYEKVTIIALEYFTGKFKLDNPKEYVIDLDKNELIQISDIVYGPESNFDSGNAISFINGKDKNLDSTHHIQSYLESKQVFLKDIRYKLEKR